MSTAQQALPSAAANGQLSFKGAWTTAATYTINDIVTLRGSTWISLKNSNHSRVPGQTTPSNAAWWRLLARGFNPVGAWSSATKYQPDDLVLYQDQTWRAKLTNTNSPPANNANWQLFAAKGETGTASGLSAGSQSTPSINFNSDTDTGIYSPGANKVAIAEGGMRFLHNLGNANTALGLNALGKPSLGIANTALGQSALANVGASGNDNTAVGMQALISNSTGSSNTAIGRAALGNITDGSNNIAIGKIAGRIAGPGTNWSIYIGSEGEIDRGGGDPPFNDSGVIRIGQIDWGGSTPDYQSKTFIAGIREADSAGFSMPLPVYIDTINGQLGVAMSSSRRVKDDIETMGDMTTVLSKLRPVTFHYKKPARDGSKPLQYGLIAEEVAEVMPYLTVNNPDGSVRTVYYDRLPTFLLAGWQAQQKTIAAQAQELREQKAINASLETRLSKLEALLPQTKAASLQ